MLSAAKGLMGRGHSQASEGESFWVDGPLRALLGRVHYKTELVTSVSWHQGMFQLKMPTFALCHPCMQDNGGDPGGFVPAMENLQDTGIPPSHRNLQCDLISLFARSVNAYLDGGNN